MIIIFNLQTYDLIDKFTANNFILQEIRTILYDEYDAKLTTLHKPYSAIKSDIHNALKRELCMIGKAIHEYRIQYDFDPWVHVYRYQDDFIVELSKTHLHSISRTIERYE